MNLHIYSKFTTFSVMGSSLPREALHRALSKTHYPLLSTGLTQEYSS